MRKNRDLTETETKTEEKTKEEKVEEESEGVLRTIADFLSTFVVTIVVVLALALLVARFTGIHLFNVESGSMTPKYPVGTLLIDKQVDPAEVSVGDVVTFVANEDGMLVTHRVVSVNRSRKTFTTKGDANNVEDPQPVMFGNVIGKVEFGIPGIGTPFAYITAAENRKIVLVVIAVLMILSIAWDYVGKNKGAKKNEQ